MSLETSVPPGIEERAEENASALPSGLSRRALLGTAAFAGAGILLAGKAGHADILRSVRGVVYLDPLVQNFAFEMEELECDFFRRSMDSKAYKEMPLRARSAINQIAMDDMAHFEMLKELRARTGNRGASGSETRNTVSTRRPREFKYPSKAFATPEGWMETALNIKTTVLQAYHGAVDLVDKDTLKLAAAIAGVEGRHLAVLLEIANQDPVPSPFEGAISSQKAGNILARYGFRGGANNVVR